MPPRPRPLSPEIGGKGRPDGAKASPPFPPCTSSSYPVHELLLPRSRGSHTSFTGNGRQPEDARRLPLRHDGRLARARHARRKGRRDARRDASRRPRVRPPLPALRRFLGDWNVTARGAFGPARFLDITEITKHVRL